jgi:anti-sigma B factor antagonist
VTFAEPRFDLREHEIDPSTTVIAVAGELHVTTAPEFSASLNDAIADGKTAVVLDMTDVAFIDSTGLSVLLNALRRVTRREGRLALVCTNPTVLRLFEITRLDSTFDIQPDVESAVASVSNRSGGQTAGGSTAGAP